MNISEVIIYTDGACSGNPGPGGWGALLRHNGKEKELSGGEAQRVKLAKELSRRATGRTLYILDEPTTGLHFHDVAKLLDVLHELVDAGNTIAVIEHNLEVIKTADKVIDLGPNGGHGGGEIVASGTPEEVASVKESYTGQFLSKLLKKPKPNTKSSSKTRGTTAKAAE